MYLHLSDFDHLRDDPNVRFREETVGTKEVVIISYMLSSDDLWTKPLGLECRGITFDKATGELLSLPLEKFFNVNEKAHTQAHAIRDIQIQAVLDKRDGSMITGIVIDDKVHLKTKKSFYSDVAIEAQKALTLEVEAFIKLTARLRLTPIFEFTSPDARIVLDYGQEPKLVLLTIRDHSSGEYMSRPAVENCAAAWSIPLVPSIEDVSSIQQLLDRAKTDEGIEGWVIYSNIGTFKVKTQWYIDRHHLIDIRERDIAVMALDETLDDLIPNLIAADANMDAIRAIEKNVSIELARIIHQVDMLSTQAARLTGKERAEWVNENAGSLVKFVHRAARGIENSDSAYKEFYRRHYIKLFSLRSIGNPNFRSEE